MTEEMRARAEVMARQLHGTGQGEVLVALLAELDRLAKALDAIAARTSETLDLQSGKVAREARSPLTVHDSPTPA